MGKDKDNNYDFDGPWDPSHILLNHTSEIFDLTGFNLSYQGQVRSTPSLVLTQSGWFIITQLNSCHEIEIFIM